MATASAITWAQREDVLGSLSGVSLKKYKKHLAEDIGLTLEQRIDALLPKAKRDMQAHMGWAVDTQRQVIKLDGNGKNTMRIGIRPLVNVYSIVIRGDLGNEIATYTTSQLAYHNVIDKFGVKLREESTPASFQLQVDVSRGAMSFAFTPKEHGNYSPQSQGSYFGWGSLHFWRGRSNIEIDCDAGYPGAGTPLVTTATNIIQAHADLVAIKVMREVGRLFSEGAANWKVMGEAANFEWRIRSAIPPSPFLGEYEPDGAYADSIAELLAQAQQTMQSYRILYPIGTK